MLEAEFSDSADSSTLQCLPFLRPSSAPAGTSACSLWDGGWRWSCGRREGERGQVWSLLCWAEEVLNPQGLCQGSSLQAEPLALLPSPTAEPTDVPELVGTVTAAATSRPGQQLFPLAQDCLSASSCGYRWGSGAEVWLGGEQNPEPVLCNG